MVNECNYIREETNIFIAQGWCLPPEQHSCANSCTEKEKTIRISTESMLGQGVSPLTSIRRSIFEWTGKESIAAMTTTVTLRIYIQYHSGW